MAVQILYGGIGDEKEVEKVGTHYQYNKLNLVKVTLNTQFMWGK